MSLIKIAALGGIAALHGAVFVTASYLFAERRFQGEVNKLKSMMRSGEDHRVAFDQAQAVARARQGVEHTMGAKVLRWIEERRDA